MRKLLVPLVVLAAALVLLALVLLALWRPWTDGAGPDPTAGEHGKGRAFESNRTAVVVDQQVEEQPAAPEPEPPGLPPAPPWEPAAGPALATPPGMVLVAGGRYGIGIDRSQAIARIEATGQRALASESPRHAVLLEPFLYGQTEVTNEQFAAFVRATGSEPPLLWGRQAIDVATLAYAEEVGKAKMQARAADRPMPVFEEFREADWWEQNWRDSEWSVPDELLDHPVVFIDHDRAAAYARWAGLRLISEEEHQVAGRGNEELAYPWGDEFAEGNANCTEARLGGTAPVGSFPDGAAWLDGDGAHAERGTPGARPIHDLCGNVWEWTRSPYVAYPKFRSLHVQLQGSREQLTPEFDADNRVSVSGSFGLPPLAVRLTTRRGTARWQTTSGLGMRCSAGTVPGEDIAESILSLDLPAHRRPAGVTYSPEAAVAIDRWYAEPSRVPPHTRSVITAHEHVTFVPVEESPFAGLVALKDRSSALPVQVGFLSTTIPLAEPPLPPGTYTLSWRAGGPLPEPHPGQQAPSYPFDPARDTLLLRSPDGALVGSLPCPGPVEELRLGPGRLDLTSDRSATLHALVPTRKPDKAFAFAIPLTFPPGALAGDWRRAQP